MIKKLSKDFVQAQANISPGELDWAISIGLVSSGLSEAEADISSPIYDERYDQNSSRYNIWKKLLVFRAIQNVREPLQTLFEEVADIAVAFGYPPDMNDLVYYMPAKDDPSEGMLIKRIKSYANLL